MNKPKIILETPKHPTKAKFLVVMTSYGRDNLLKDAIRSVRGQKLEDLILVIIDDNSTAKNPRTQEIIREQAHLDDRIIFFRTETDEKTRKSVATFCRNINWVLKYASKHLKVEYVSYLPCDDAYYDNKLSLSAEYLDKHPAVLACWTPLMLVSPNRQQLHRIPHIHCNAVHRPVAVLDHSCVVHRFMALYKLPYPWWPVDKKIEHSIPDGIFFDKLVKVGGPIQCATQIITGEKLRHGDSIQGRVARW